MSGTRRPIVPPATIGMLGGGQLGRFALLAALDMGYRTIVLDPDPSAPAGLVANEHLVAAYDDPGALVRLAGECDVVTIEFENPPAHALDYLAEHTRVAPSPDAVRVAQDRIAEKRFLAEQGFPIGPYVELVEDDPNADGLAEIVLGGAVVKTARLGYDGKGQRRVLGLDALHAAWAELGGVPCVVERLLDLRMELSVLVARTADGETVTWPPAENDHADGILDTSVVPARIDAVLADRAEGLAVAIADALGYVGVLAVEMFVVADDDGIDRLLINELAPRPHNSGHWTLDAAVTNQFEQQIRAVCGLGLGDTAMTAPAVAMVNVLGDVWDGGDPNWAAVLDDRRAKLHLYGKYQPRRGRKMGHVTLTSTNASAALTRVRELAAELPR